ncbi:MAG TPA: DUF262 domain-containing protein [Symbiobacteriaceae bacterium]|jgi:hypothetical protein
MTDSSFYAADLSVHQLMGMMDDGGLVIPSFQRGYVWTSDMASGFIVSLLTGFPVSQIYLMEDTQSVLHVLDGSQRLRALRYFRAGKHANGLAFALHGVDDEYEGKTYASLSHEQRLMLEHTVFHAIVVKQEHPDEWGLALTIYERLNVTGLRLHRQDIRAARHPGGFVQLLRELSEDEAWLALVSHSDGPEYEELILRFFALLYEGDHYRKPMTRFLDTFLEMNKDLRVISSQELSILFRSTTKLIDQHIGSKAFRPKKSFNIAIYDAVMIGVGARLRSGPVVGGHTDFKVAYQTLIDTPEFNQLAQAPTSDESALVRRLNLAKFLFGAVQ